MSSSLDPSSVLLEPEGSTCNTLTLLLGGGSSYGPLNAIKQQNCAVDTNNTLVSNHSINFNKP